MAIRAPNMLWGPPPRRGFLAAFTERNREVATASIEGTRSLQLQCQGKAETFWTATGPFRPLVIAAHTDACIAVEWGVGMVAGLVGGVGQLKNIAEGWATGRLHEAPDWGRAASDVLFAGLGIAGGVGGFASLVRLPRGFSGGTVLPRRYLIRGFLETAGETPTMLAESAAKRGTRGLGLREYQMAMKSDPPSSGLARAKGGPPPDHTSPVAAGARMPRVVDPEVIPTAQRIALTAVREGRMTIDVFQRLIIASEGEVSRVGVVIRYSRLRRALPRAKQSQLDAAMGVATGRPGGLWGGFDIDGVVERLERAEAIGAIVQARQIPISATVFERGVLCRRRGRTADNGHAAYAAWREGLSRAFQERLDTARQSAMAAAVETRPNGPQKGAAAAGAIRKEAALPVHAMWDTSRSPPPIVDTTPAGRVGWAEGYADWLMERDRTVRGPHFRARVLDLPLDTNPVTLTSRWEAFVRPLDDGLRRSLHVSFRAATGR